MHLTLQITSNVPVHLHVCSPHDDAVLSRLNDIETALTTISQQGITLMAQVQDLLDDLDAIKQNTADYIASRDAIDVDLKAQLAAALASAKTAMDQLTASQNDTAAATAAKQALQDGIDAAFAKAEADKALLAPPQATPTPTADAAAADPAVAAAPIPDAVQP